MCFLKVLIFISMCVLLAQHQGCGLFRGPEVTDDLIARYIYSYGHLKKLGVELAITTNGVSANGASRDELDQVVMAAGFNDFSEFSRTGIAIDRAMKTARSQAPDQPVMGGPSDASVQACMRNMQSLKLVLEGR